MVSKPRAHNEEAMQVKDLMTKDNILVADPADRLYETFLVMQRHKIKHMPVMDDTELLGIVSERDLLAYATHEMGSNMFPRKILDEIMTRKLITCGPDTEVDEAIRLMIDNNIHSLLVLENGRLIGIVTAKDILSLMLIKSPQGPQAHAEPDAG
jgi:acetoin utilization protein AcuB